MKPIVPLLSILLTACATDRALTAAAPSTQVSVVVAARCIDPADAPVPPKTALVPGMSFDQRVKAMASDLYAYESYVLNADPLIRKCTTTPKASDVAKPK